MSLRIHRELYREAPRAGTSELVSAVGYTGPGTEREEIRKASESPDNYQAWQRRVSADNGRTWGPYQDLAEVTRQLADGGIVTYPFGPDYDPATGIAYRLEQKRIWPGLPIYTFDWSTHEHPFHDHVFVRESTPDGEERLVQLTHEEGADWDPERPFDEAFVLRNRAYHGQRVSFDGRGWAFHPLSCIPSSERYGHTKAGVVLMRRDPDTGRWRASNRRFVDPTVSSRGLLEPDAAVLNDGRILVVCRGSDTPETPGRKWMTVSEDGGATIGPVKELLYDDGERFYSPSSIHRFYRPAARPAVSDSLSDRLYWIGNIVPEPPAGNRPRYPLVIAEVDQERCAVVRESVSVIDTRAGTEPEDLSLSNFQILQNRETGCLELYMTRDAAFENAQWRSSVYRYVIEGL